jgi:hypothetical protein
VNASQAWLVNAPQARKKRTKNKYDAPPQAAAVVLEKEETEPARSRLRRSSGSREPETDLAVSDQSFEDYF